MHMARSHRITSFHKALGSATNQKGREAEIAVLATLIRSEGNPLPAWVEAARYSTPDEERRGIDIVVMTDVGRLFLQVKRSREGVRRFLKAHAHTRIQTVVVRSVVCFDQIKTLVIQALSTERNKLLALRNW